MKKSSTYIILFLIFPLAFLLSCEKENTQDPCADIVVLRVMINEKLKDTSETRYRFTSSATFLENETTPILKYTGLENPSAAVIITDKEINKLPASSNNLTLKVYKNDSLIVSQPYIVGKDSCHVLLLEGPAKITIK